MKVVILGAGTMGRVHTSGYSKIPDVEIAGIFDKNFELGKSLANSYKTRFYTDFDEMIEKEKPDIVDICLPTIFHKEYTIKSAKKKINVICEKPIARTIEDGKEMIKVCEENRIKFMVAHVLRFFPEYLKAKEVLEEGLIGEPAIARTSRGAHFPRGVGDWYKNLKESGGVILDMIIHDFDYLRWCFGDVERVYAKSLTFKKYEYIDYALVTLRFKNGVIAHVEGSWAYPEGVSFVEKLEIAGSKGIIEFDLNKTYPTYVYIKKKEETASVAVPESPFDEDPYAAEIRHFVECVRDDKEPCIPALDALKALQISLSALNSAEKNEVVKIQPII
jgi:predicted dehydrogenase